MKLTILDKLFLGLIWAPFLPVLSLLMFWWSAYLLNAGDRTIAILSFYGLMLGLIACVLTFKSWLSRGYRQSRPLLVGLYLFYMIGIFGFFMGVPLFNIGPGIAAVLFIARRDMLLGVPAEQLKRDQKFIRGFTLAGLLLVCAASALIAVTDHSTGANLKGMLMLDFNVDNRMIWGIIVGGGSLLLLAQYLISKIISTRAYEK